MSFEQGQLGSEDGNKFRPDKSAKEGYTPRDEQPESPEEDEQEREAEEAEKARVRNLSEVELVREMGTYTDQLEKLGQLDESYTDIVATPGHEDAFQILVDEDKRRTQELGEEFIQQARIRQESHPNITITLAEARLAAQRAQAEFLSITDEEIRKATTGEAAVSKIKQRLEARRKYLVASIVPLLVERRRSGK